jgi:signal peptidase I
MSRPNRDSTCKRNDAKVVAPSVAALLDRARRKWIDYWTSPQPKKDALFLGAFFAVVLVVNGTVAGNIYVPTGSMRDTIAENERFVVWKLGYGVQNPLAPRQKLRFHDEEFLRWKDVARGDIAVFVPPKRTGVNDKYVKRVVALPGETVEVRAGVGVSINGRLLEEEYLRELPQYWMPPQVVPQGKVFVLGDNRNNSYDSHAWGFLDLESIQGVMTFRYWPITRMGFMGQDSQRNNSIACILSGCVLAGYFCWQFGKGRFSRSRSA